MSTALKQALASLNDAQSMVSDVLRRDYPPGAEIKWRNGYRRFGKGTVVTVADDGKRIVVKNSATNAVYGITPAQVGWIDP